MIKQIVAILLTAAIAAAMITACGKTAESQETTAVTVEETETKQKQKRFKRQLWRRQNIHLLIVKTVIAALQRRLLVPCVMVRDL